MEPLSVRLENTLFLPEAYFRDVCCIIDKRL